VIDQRRRILNLAFDLVRVEMDLRSLYSEMQHQLPLDQQQQFRSRLNALLVQQNALSDALEALAGIDETQAELFSDVRGR